MRKKRLLLVGLVVIGLATVWFAFLRSSGEPKYQRRYLSQWMAAYEDAGKRLGYDPFDSTARSDWGDATRGLQAIGTNALPHYLRWVSAKPRPWQTSLRNHLPAWIEKNKRVRDWLGDGTGHEALRGRIGLNLLGTNAVGAIPALVAMLQDYNDPQNAEWAGLMLGDIGEPAIPALLAAFADTNAPDRESLVRGICFLTYKLGTNATGVVLTAALHDDDPAVSNAAEQCLREFYEWTLTNTPAK